MVKLLSKLFLKETDKTQIQLFRYLFVGGFAFLVDFTFLYVFTEYFKIHYLWSAALAFCLGLTINYIISTLWVFKTRKIVNRLNEFLIFGFVGIIGLGFNELFIWGLTEIFLIYYMVSKGISTIIVFLWNFFVRKYLLFNKKDNNTTKEN